MIKNKRRKFYEEELVFASPSTTPREKNYFIERTRVVDSKKLRSGSVKGGEKQYLLKARNDPEQSSWISSTEYQSLKDGGYLE